MAEWQKTTYVVMCIRPRAAKMPLHTGLCIDVIIDLDRVLAIA